MARAFLVGRILVGCYYIQSAFHHFTNVGHMARAAAAHGVPAPELAIIGSGVLLLVAGLSFLLGLFPRIGVAALVLFLVPVTLIMHAFWAGNDPVQQQNNLIHFTKNIGLLGSSLMFLAVPRPWPYSVERRLRLPVRAPV
jgi:putative oxidoreductase